MTRSLKDKTLFITGATRGIGKAIGIRAARDGANIVLFGKTAEPHPKLPGTLYTAAEEMQAAGGKTLVCIGDVRDEDSLNQALAQTKATFGGLDILVNNASAMVLTGTLDTDMKRYDLVHSINTRGTFLTSKLAIPLLREASNPHVLNLAPPLSLQPKWFAPHVGYSMAKFGMSLCVLGMSEEFKGEIAFNALWPRTMIATSAVSAHLGGDTSINQSRTPEIMADASWYILTRDKSCSGNFFVDEYLLREEGIEDFLPYQLDPTLDPDQLMPDFFID